METRARLFFQQRLLEGARPDPFDKPCDTIDEMLKSILTLTFQLPTACFFMYPYVEVKLTLKSSDNYSKVHLDPQNLIEAFQGILECTAYLISGVLQLYLIVKCTESSNAGLTFVVLCLTKKLIEFKTLRNLWHE